MLLDYQIRLDLASGMISYNEVEWVNSLHSEQRILYFRGKVSIFLVAYPLSHSLVNVSHYVR